MNPYISVTILVSYITSEVVNCAHFPTLLPEDHLEKQLNTTELSVRDKSYMAPCVGITCPDGRCVTNILLCAHSNVSAYNTYVHRKELSRRRTIMFHYIFAAFAVCIIIGIFLYFTSIPEEDMASNGRYEAKYTAPVKRQEFSTSVPNVGGISAHPNNQATFSKYSDNSAGDEFWWDDDQEVYSSETRHDLELSRV